MRERSGTVQYKEGEIDERYCAAARATGPPVVRLWEDLCKADAKVGKSEMKRWRRWRVEDVGPAIN